ncbi:acyl-CoA dehydrogenase/oxidase [Protomyces lactucae-debilis]|uniref:Acyl-CoA dehydrogenase/oxidase n=1 Tax=Protomyces lactucae-debilis TaxID=2754530 RepID=A0A1Y2FQG8_PROLT|nr:acyl-CoA dehydrogenase/oxidase [Protomyces lactucae-debilis]ORY86241.1 acyl-CoA dehydrogenase/oxidase [Protomyces lactucae-debilis]
MKHTPFIQQGFALANQYDADDSLQQVLNLYLSPDVRAATEKDMRALGALAVSREQLEHCAEAERNQPYVEHYDTFGNKTSKLVTSAGWKYMKKVAAEQGLVSVGYENAYGDKTRVVQFARLYIMNCSMATFLCPLAMADGAARIMKDFDRDIYDRLISRNPEEMWTSGQWMTERSGGSDLSNYETVAVHDGTGYRLTGFKWFSSATDANMSLALAKTQEGISLFLVDLEAAGSSIQIARLKNKLGTHALPTAELELNGVPARLIGQAGRGVKAISTILNITRIYTAVTACSGLRRAYGIVKAYSEVRMIKDKKLIQKPLHQRTMTQLLVTLTALTHLSFYVTALLGKDEAGTASPEERILLRCLTPLAKAFVSKKSHLGVGECCEAMGGLGYIETALKDPASRKVLAERFNMAPISIAEEADLKDVMFDVAHGVCATLLTEAAVTLKDDRLQEMAIRWNSPRNRGERSDAWLLGVDNSARL